MIHRSPGKPQRPSKIVREAGELAATFVLCAVIFTATWIMAWIFKPDLSSSTVSFIASIAAIIIAFLKEDKETT